MSYYIQRHASGYVGNCLLWWAKGGNGYTCDLDRAEVFGDQDASALIERDAGDKYTAWEKSYIDSACKRHADSECLNINMKGIRAAPTPSPDKRCGTCGRFNECPVAGHTCVWVWPCESWTPKKGGAG